MIYSDNIYTCLAMAQFYCYTATRNERVKEKSKDSLIATLEETRDEIAG